MWVALWCIFGVSKFMHKKHKSAAEVANEIRERERRKAAKTIQQRARALEVFSTATAATETDKKTE
jgi:hypothetical protein